MTGVGFQPRQTSKFGTKINNARLKSHFQDFMEFANDQ